MKVLFVSSGNSINGITSIVKNQAQSLEEAGIEVQYFSIIGKGLTGYLKNIRKLKTYLKSADIDLIHAHYSLSAILVSLTFTKMPIVVSLMGSDIKSGFFWKTIIKLFSYLFWNVLIVKSEKMQKDIKVAKSIVLPNGTNIKLFIPRDKITCQVKLGWNTDKKHVLFAANPSRTEKNFKLAQQAISRVKTKHIELHVLENIDFNEMPYFFGASDVVLLTSFWEGSPNVIKEAMACNRPIVATNVGDVKWLLEDVAGCFLTSFDPDDTSRQIEKAIEFSNSKGKTNGREKIIKLGLDSESVAKKLILLYQNLINK